MERLHNMVNGKKVFLTPEEERETRERWAENERIQREIEASHGFNRKPEYPPIEDQLDMLWHDMNQGHLPNLGSFYTTIKAIKEKYPKN